MSSVHDGTISTDATMFFNEHENKPIVLEENGFWSDFC